MLAFTVVLPLTMAAVLAASGIGKLRHPDDLAGWEQLGVPASLRRAGLLRLHPWGELALAAAIALLGSLLGLLAGFVTIALMVAYTVVVIRALRNAEDGDASCACFGSAKPVTALTVVRNVWLTALAIGATAVSWTTPLWGGPLLAGASSWTWLVATVVAAATTALILWPSAPSPTASSAVASAMTRTRDEDGVVDYVRTRTPSVPVMTADGVVINLRQLATAKPILLLAVSEFCTSCEPVLANVARYRELLPEVAVRLLLMLAPEDSRLTERTEPQSVHDTNGYVRESIAEWPTPTAVLLGVDGLLAGGPETGATAIEAFVDDIYESLHGVRPSHASPRTE